MSYSVWWIASIFSAVILFLVAHFVASERDKALKRRPRLPNHLQDEMSLQFHKFPPTFFWGAATAAHQVEGGLRKNQWAAWENATRHDGQPACIHKSEDACNHWELFDKDLQLMSSLNLNMYRFSIEWSRIEPEEGVFDEEALLRYVEWCEKLQAQGIEPMVTLHHFTEPLWFHQRGGFETDWGVEQFARFAEQVVRALGPRCRYYVTVNEPLVYTMAGWVDGQFPPGKRDFRLGLEVTRRLLLAHARAYRVIKQHQPGAQVGLAKHVVLFEAQRWWFPLDALAAALLDESFNWAPLRACVTGDVRLGVPLPFAPRVERHHPLLAGTLDFVGVNHYRTAWRQGTDPWGLHDRPRLGLR